MVFKYFGFDKQKIPAIGQGCMGIGGGLNRDTKSDKEYIASIQHGINLGMTLIDTAEVYGEGHSEEIVGKAILGKRSEIFLCTKFSPENNYYSNVIHSCDNSLSRLKTNYIDLYQIHWPNPLVQLEETLRAMEDLIQEGKVRHIGVSNFSMKQIYEAKNSLKKTILFSNQVEYNLFDRYIEKSILPYCQQNNMAVIAYSPLNKGKLNNNHEILNELSLKYQKSISQIILNWLIFHKNVIVIPKSANLKHVDENAKSADFIMEESDYKIISEKINPHPKLISPQKICVSTKGYGNRKVYQTLQEALDNKLSFVPSPSQLANEIKNEDEIKPVRLIRREQKSDEFEFDLVEGRIRYWAWVIAYGFKKNIPSLIY